MKMTVSGGGFVSVFSPFFPTGVANDSQHFGGGQIEIYHCIGKGSIYRAFIKYCGMNLLIFFFVSVAAATIYCILSYDFIARIGRMRAPPRKAPENANKTNNACACGINFEFHAIFVQFRLSIISERWENGKHARRVTMILKAVNRANTKKITNDGR